MRVSLEGIRTASPKIVSPFGMLAAAYVIARDGYELHRDMCEPDVRGPLQRPYEKACGLLCEAMSEAACAAVRFPCDDSAELAIKLAIFAAEDMQGLEAAKELIGVIVTDAERIGNEA